MLAIFLSIGNSRNLVHAKFKITMFYLVKVQLIKEIVIQSAIREKNARKIFWFAKFSDRENWCSRKLMLAKISTFRVT